MDLDICEIAFSKEPAVLRTVFEFAKKNIIFWFDKWNILVWMNHHYSFFINSSNVPGTHPREDAFLCFFPEVISCWFVPSLVDIVACFILLWLTTLYLIYNQHLYFSQSLLHECTFQFLLKSLNENVYKHYFVTLTTIYV